MMAFEQYVHHGNAVHVRSDLKGKHREHCLCFSCSHFHPEDRAKNCGIADRVYMLCVDEHLVLPVWECPMFSPCQEQMERAAVEFECDAYDMELCGLKKGPDFFRAEVKPRSYRVPISIEALSLVSLCEAVAAFGRGCRSFSAHTLSEPE